MFPIATFVHELAVAVQQSGHADGQLGQGPGQRGWRAGGRERSHPIRDEELPRVRWANPIVTVQAP